MHRKLIDLVCQDSQNKTWAPMRENMYEKEG
jgi:hypothetical protein